MNTGTVYGAWRHGTVSGYTNHGCRCDECRKASRDKARGLRGRIGDEKYSALIHRYTTRKYGVSTEEYNRLLILQKNKCALCMNCETRKLRGKVARLCVDHDHITGKVRGLLCHKCNTAIGFLADNPITMERAIEYLKKFLP